jgi:hypothetical protein
MTLKNCIFTNWTKATQLEGDEIFVENFTSYHNGYGIEIDGWGTGISNGMLKDCVIWDNSWNGIWVDYVSNFTVDNCYVYDFDSFGVAGDGNAMNYVKNSVFNATGGYKGYFEYVVFSNTTFYGDAPFEHFTDSYFVDPIHEYMMDEGSGSDAQDSGSVVQDCDLVNGTAWVSGVYGDAVVFDRILQSHLNCGNDSSFNFGTGDATIQFWLYGGTSPYNQDLIFKSDPSYNYGYNVVLDNGDGAVDGGFYDNVEVDWVEGATDIRGGWHLVTIVRNSTNVMLYIDDALDSVDAYYGADSDTVYPLIVGGSYVTNPNGYWANATMDNLRMWDRALDESEIIDIYNYVPPLTPNECRLYLNGVEGNTTAVFGYAVNVTSTYSSDGVSRAYLEAQGVDVVFWQGFWSQYIGRIETMYEGFPSAGTYAMTSRADEEGGFESCNVTYYLTLSEPIVPPITGMLTATGAGLGNFISSISDPVVNFILVLGLIGGVLSIFMAIAFVIKGALTR